MPCPVPKPRVSSFSNGTEVAEMAFMYLILNYAVGGQWGDVSNLPNTTEWPVGHIDRTKIDWVRVWTSASSKISNWAYSATDEPWSGTPPPTGPTAPRPRRRDLHLRHRHSDGSTPRLGRPPHTQCDQSRRRHSLPLRRPDDRLVLGYGTTGARPPAINLAATTTSEQEFYGELDGPAPSQSTMTRPNRLLLTGKVMGGDGIAINGPGVVSFDGSKTPTLEPPTSTPALQVPASPASVARTRWASAMWSSANTATPPPPVSNSKTTRSFRTPSRSPAAPTIHGHPQQQRHEHHLGHHQRAIRRRSILDPADAGELRLTGTSPGAPRPAAPAPSRSKAPGRHGKRNRRQWQRHHR